jgi:citrate lyase subunit beta/citryl-CoA lyase
MAASRLVVVRHSPAASLSRGMRLLARSYLYVPGDRPERFTKALDSGADAVIFDLEDAVPLDGKDEARASVVGLLSEISGPDTAQWVRINAGSRGLDDTRSVVGLPGLTGILVPKSTPESVAAIVSLAGRVTVGALVESAVGILKMAEIAGSSGVGVIALGEVDMAADLGMIATEDGDELWPVRLSAVVASAAHSLVPPIGPVWLDIRDLGGLRASTELLRRRGFAGRQAIHPSQVGVINEALSPSAEELERAAHVLQLADAAGGGACVDEDGRMVDEAVLRSARRLLAP